MKNNKSIDVVFILDKSGSMQHITKDTIEGFNEMLNKQREYNAKVTTVLFNNIPNELYFRKNIDSVNNLTVKDYNCGGCTALYDAIGYTIEKLDKENIKNKVLFIITTDGLENASLDYNRKQIFDLINKHKDWEFLYLGADIDVFTESSNIGIKRKNSASYSKSNGGIKRLFSAFSECIDEVYYSNENDIDFKLEDKLKETK